MAGVAAVVIGIAGCAASPSERLADVVRAVELARSEGAARWAPNALAEAESLLGSAEQEIFEQQGRRVSVRNFRIARLLLDDAARQAENALETARSAGVAARARAERSMRTASDAVEKVRAAWLEIPRGADTVDDRAGLGRDIEALEELLVRAEVRFEAGAYDEAAADAEAVNERGLRIATTAERSLDHHLLGGPGPAASR